jgi:phosphate transport system substrate-binding protein
MEGTMSTPLGRALRTAPLVIGIASLAVATLVQANPTSRTTTTSPARHTTSPWRHVKRNAGPGPIYFSGGATLPAVAYVGAQQAAAGQPNPAVVPGPGTNGSVLGYFASTYSPNKGADSFTYCQTGSGFGKSVMNGDNDNLSAPSPAPLPPNANLPCASPVGTASVAMINGFGAVGQDFGDFSGSDAPLNATEYTDWNNNQMTSGRSIFGRGLPVQIPYIVGSVAILYNNSDPAVESQQINISVTQLCKISDGEITNWHTLNHAFASKTLAFTDRKDKSGTSFSFSNYLNNICKGAGETYGVSQNYDEYIPGNPSIGALPNPLPAKANHNFFLNGSGNGGVVAAIQAQDGAIGYVEAANALGAVNGTNLNFATIGGKDPVKDLPLAAGSISVTGLLQSMAVGSDVANARAPLVSLSPTDNCVLLENPLSYAKPAKGYPIVAVTNLELSQTGNGANAKDLQTLAYMMSQRNPEAVGPGKITTVDLYGVSTLGTTGYSTLNQAKFGKTLKTTATSCIGS